MSAVPGTMQLLSNNMAVTSLMKLPFVVCRAYPLVAPMSHFQLQVGTHRRQTWGEGASTMSFEDESFVAMALHPRPRLAASIGALSTTTCWPALANRSPDRRE